MWQYRKTYYRQFSMREKWSFVALLQSKDGLLRYCCGRKMADIAMTGKER
jgi:hypothetical protein